MAVGLEQGLGGGANQAKLMVPEAISCGLITLYVCFASTGIDARREEGVAGLFAGECRRAVLTDGQLRD